MFWGNEDAEFVGVMNKYHVSLDIHSTKMIPFPALLGWPGIGDCLSRRPRVKPNITVKKERKKERQTERKDS